MVTSQYVMFICDLTWMSVVTCTRPLGLETIPTTLRGARLAATDFVSSITRFPPSCLQPAYKPRETGKNIYARIVAMYTTYIHTLYVLMYFVSIIHWIDVSSRARARGTGTVWILSERDQSVRIMNTLCDHRAGQAFRKSMIKGMSPLDLANHRGPKINVFLHILIGKKA